MVQDFYIDSTPKLDDLVHQFVQDKILSFTEKTKYNMSEIISIRPKLIPKRTGHGYYSHYLGEEGQIYQGPFCKEKNNDMQRLYLQYTRTQQFLSLFSQHIIPCQILQDNQHENQYWLIYPLEYITKITNQTEWNILSKDSESERVQFVDLNSLGLVCLQNVTMKQLLKCPRILAKLIHLFIFRFSSIPITYTKLNYFYVRCNEKIQPQQNNDYLKNENFLWEVTKDDPDCLFMLQLDHIPMEPNTVIATNISEQNNNNNNNIYHILIKGLQYDKYHIETYNDFFTSKLLINCLNENMSQTIQKIASLPESSTIIQQSYFYFNYSQFFLNHHFQLIHKTKDGSL